MVISSRNVSTKTFDLGGAYQRRLETVQACQNAGNTSPVLRDAVHNTNYAPDHPPPNYTLYYAAADYDRRSKHNCNGQKFEISHNNSKHQNSGSDTVQSLSKKGFAVEAYFRDRKFSGASEQLIDNLICDFEICADVTILHKCA